MKKFILGSFIAAVVIVFSFSSCGKYEDGPAFSLLTKKSRLCGDWVLDKYMVNDVDQTANFQAVFGTNYVWDIEKDGAYHVHGSVSDDGTWELGEDKDDVRFKSSQANSSEVSYRILRLKSKELWLKHTESNGDVTKLYLKAE